MSSSSTTGTLIYLPPGNSDRAIDELKYHLHVCSSPGFDPWTNVVSLHLAGSFINFGLLETLNDFLNLPLAQDPTGCSKKEKRWIYVTVEGATFPEFDHQMQDLCYAIADRTLGLKIARSPDLLSYLLGDMPEIKHLMVETLHIEDPEGLSRDEHERLGAIIASSVQLRELDLRLPVAAGANLLFDSLANAVNLQALSLHKYRSQNALAEALVESNGPLLRLLQNPQNQLKKLNLSRLELNNQHLIAISQLLPTCRIEEFDVVQNLIRLEGILEFARQLPRMHSLKRVQLGSNPWEHSAIACKTIGAALLQGIMENTSIESMDCLLAKPHGPLHWHYLNLNRAGRRLLASSQPIPEGLWPLVLERAGDAQRYLSYDLRFDEASSDEIGGDSSSDETSVTSSIISRKPPTARYNAVYFLCKNLLRLHPFRLVSCKRQLEGCEMTTSKHPRLVTNVEKSLRWDVAADGEQAPRWARNIEQQLAEMLEPVIRLEDGTVPPNFPVTLEELLHSDEDRIDELLRFYGLPDNGTIHDKKESLTNFLGVNL